MASESDGIKLARLEEQMKTMFRQQEKLTEEITDLSRDVKDLVATMNKGKGAFGFAMVLAGSMGAIAVKVIGAIMTKM